MTSVMRTLDEISAEALAGVARDLAGRAGTAPHVVWIARMRYRGQGHELEVPFTLDTPPDELGRRFTGMHRQRYGFVLDVAAEVVSARCARSGSATPVLLARRGESSWASDSTLDTGGELDATIEGRRVVALRDATMLVPEGWTARALPIGGWFLEQR